MTKARSAVRSRFRIISQILMYHVTIIRFHYAKFFATTSRVMMAQPIQITKTDGSAKAEDVMPDLPPTLSHRSGWLLILRPVRLALRLWRGFLHAYSLSGQRRDLARLDARMLEDISVTPDQARRESSRAFWDAPDHWRL
ncbi:DUF1127 domain-containing protein [Pseudogemmobacter faecipullorum]|uniref:DUF1127 domain-containing protein n=1 Tax=Pseudogemmobacter faecipullorum TaxID=2755041 RepID=UPI001D00E84E|nr:hypothetical protein [Pseudogemmobacter faecipullorum]